MGKEKIIQGLKKNTMVIVLIIVFLFFTVRTGGSMILPQNINNLIAQNSYVFILATGMLLCILTGGNIDLSVGSVVAFVGAIGGALMVNMKFSTPLTLVVMIVVGILIGIWQGFWIAYVRIPPFIVTLAGMLMFRGVANIVLQGRTLAPLPNDFMGIFNGYVPDFFGGQGFNITCMLIGVLAVVLYSMLTLKNRKDKIKKGYEVADFKAVLFRLVLISVVILWFTNRLAMYKGIPNVLIWVAVVILLYAYHIKDNNRKILLCCWRK